MTLAWSFKPTKTALAAVCVAMLSVTNVSAQNEPSKSATRLAGTIKTIAGNRIILTEDNGSELSILVQNSAKVVAVAPGQKDLQNAQPIQVRDLLPGDRILVRGSVAVDGKPILASSVIAMKKADLADKQARDREDWQKNGIGGLVRAIDPSAETITVGVMSAKGSTEVAIRVTTSTIVRRYAPNSLQFDRATLSSLDQIKLGDQLRARGSRGPGENDFAASEIVTGSFRNIAGTVSSVDSADSSLQVEDLAAKKSVRIKITQESQVRKLSPPIAQRIAQQLKGNGTENEAAGTASRPSPQRPDGTRQGATGSRSGAPERNGGAPDVQQMILRMPPSILSDFRKSDAVMVVATQGNGGAQVTAIILLGGVEPILASSSNTEVGSLLSPWSLSSGGGGDVGP